MKNLKEDEKDPGDQLIVRYWKNIAKFTPFCEKTVRQHFSKEMVELGFVFCSSVGKGKMRRKIYWSYPDRIKSYFIQKQLENGKI